MKRCPRCNGTQTDPIADIHYLRECRQCLFRGEEFEFEEDLEPTYSWHIVEHDGVAWQVVQVMHWPSRIEMESIAVHLAEDAAREMVDLLRAAAPEQERELEYQHVDYK